VAQPEVWGGPLKAYVNGLEARIGIGQWFRFYNERRLRQALRYKTPGRRGRPRWAFWFIAALGRRWRVAHNSTGPTTEKRGIHPTGKRSGLHPYKRAYAAMSLGSTADIHLL
jgi:hypothetical protein